MTVIIVIIVTVNKISLFNFSLFIIVKMSSTKMLQFSINILRINVLEALRFCFLYLKWGNTFANTVSCRHKHRTLHFCYCSIGSCDYQVLKKLWTDLTEIFMDISLLEMEVVYQLQHPQKQGGTNEKRFFFDHLRMLIPLYLEWPNLAHWLAQPFSFFLFCTLCTIL